MRDSPAFGDFVQGIGLKVLWDAKGAPDLCRKGAGGGYDCD
jgi:hypothetical protein